MVKKGASMKIKDLTKLMNDHGTVPRIKVLKYNEAFRCMMQIYEGAPRRMDEAIAAMKVNSFTVLGKGFIEIYV